MACGLIYWLVHGENFDVKALSNILAEPLYVLLFIGLVGMNLMVVNLRWFVLLSSQGFYLKFKDVFSLGLIGIFFNYAIPGSVGGDLIKGYYLVRDHPQRKLQAGFTIVVDRALGLYVMSLMALVALVANYSFLKSEPMLMATALGVFSLFLLMTIFVYSSCSEKLKEKWLNFFKRFPSRLPILHLYESLHSYRESKKALLYAMGLSVLAQLFMILCFLSVGRILGEELGIMTYFFAVSVGFIVSSVPIAPAGVGVGQVAMLFLFEVYSGTNSQSGPIGLSIVQLSLLMWGLVGAYFYLRPNPHSVGEI